MTAGLFLWQNTIVHCSAHAQICAIFLRFETWRIWLYMQPLESNEKVSQSVLSPDSRIYPLIVDLDHTLILTDSLYEHLAVGLFTNPSGLARAVPLLQQGRAAFKAGLSSRIAFSAEHLPLREDLVQWLRDEATKGREIHLCSAANRTIVEAIERRLGLFHSAVGSDVINLKGAAKADYLDRTFPDGFVYAGDSAADLAVWAKARGIVLAGVAPGVASEARRLGKPIEAEFRSKPLGIRPLLKALRVHHWSKNALIFVPLILSHGWTDPSAILHVLLGLCCLLMVTSATYLMNDIADLEADRRHWSKKHRALASGLMSIRAGFTMAGCALVLAFIGALLLSHAFALALASYLALTLAYSFGLKRIPLLDTLVIGILFTTRLVMGIALLGQPLAEWLLTFSVFFFVSLAIAKRHTEIIRAGSKVSHSLERRGYRVEDEPLTLALGVASSVASLVIMVLFIAQEAQRGVVYHHPKMLWGIPVILSIWVGRIWLLAHRGQMNDDPVSFALRDKSSLLIGAATAVFFFLAL
ncbi:UbiA family prenyltransferase [Lichenifustis flavocetrariae]|uniref:UbiA family prenyltransferase n=1 Tax=Lichenifustis flavocetrariae TaxID=2949735 RepID=A0AA41YWG1_9HYPH|nr:UbiA family prenyltransferase [Lichenifustis flavocetrariae]MCW6508565.1 UbiA family prenyltransferase [Lichenifustis flavocetrariae]